MGVQGLWELLAPVGRRVSVETLSGKKLAIDASIWMIQFMKAMRDERGEMVRNAHLLGFFRRICKLLFLRAKPVFVFDGGTPALKRRTVAARRRLRENARAKIRKTAEKLLLNHLKSKKLEELAEEIKTSKFGVNGDLNKNQVISANDDISSAQSYQGFDRAINQEILDEMLAASIAAEEEGKLAGNESVPSEDVNYEEEGEEDEDEEMIFPINSGNIDPAVLASLPPSMQLDLLDQMREKLMAENRQKYQKFKKVPSKFSELQIHSYLKTVAFRREINEVQKCASGRGVGGLQTSRIASEANREYIFSSSFSGDKLKLTPTGAEKNGGVVNHEMRMTTASDASKRKLFTSPSRPSNDTSLDAVTRESTSDVETYLDDRGRVRVSRVRGLGIHMTRDLQRNLDLMKEYELVHAMKDLNNIAELNCDNAACDFPKRHSQTNDTPSLTRVNEGNCKCISTPLVSDGTYEEISRGTQSPIVIPEKEAAIEISFSEEEIGSKTKVDSFFMNLVSENTIAELTSESTSLEKNMNDFESECIWEDGVVVEQSSNLKNIDEHENQPSFRENKGCEEDEIAWEEDAYLIRHSMESVVAVSQGLLEEEADLKEAIRRSLEDVKLKKVSSVVPVLENTRTIVKNQNSLTSVKNDQNIEVPVQRAQLQSASIGVSAEECSHNINVFPDNEHLSSPAIQRCWSNGESSLKDDKNNLDLCNNLGLSPDIQPIGQCENQVLKKNQCNIASNLMNDEPNLRKTDNHVFLERYTKSDFEPTCRRVDSGSNNTANNSVIILSNHTSEMRSSICSSGVTFGVDLSESTLTEKMPTCIDELQELAENDTYEDPGEELSFRDQASIHEEDKVAASEANLRDEISVLKQERAYLGNEQRKLERNAESVSSEMFAECQELLQMFGLPYIIAPMEAEAQCAYMEMTNLVDGIVTDDSDVFLFGARNVFKNIFDDRKYVETYFMKDIENELGLSRDKLIRMALLLGSDYTEGVSGIGIVNAIEVINAFPEKDDLLKFKNWVESPDPSIFGLQNSQHGDSLSKVSSNANGNASDGMETNADCSESEGNIIGAVQSSNNTIPDTEEKKVFMDKHRNVSKNWHFPPSFPSESVVNAYISPQIDESTEPFAWGKPDLPLLRKICWEKFGWPTQKADELLVPVLKEYNKHETQLRMEAFYSFNERFAKIRSQRIKKAVKGIAGISSSILTDITDCGPLTPKKRGVALLNDEQSQLENDTDGPVTTEKKSSKQSRKDTKKQSLQPHVSAESSKQGGGGNKRDHLDSANGSRRGRGRGIRREGEHLHKEFTKPASVDENSAGETERSTMMVESVPEMRRSTRRRKQVNYAEDNSEINELLVRDKATDAAALEHSEAVTRARTFGNDTDSSNEIQEEQSFSVTVPTTELFEDHCHSPIDVGNRSSYFVSGGGFCIDDESEPGMPDTAERLQEDCTSHELDLGANGQGDSSKGCEGVADEDLRVLENLGREDDGVNGSAKYMLSAMPSLKRKRRKR